MIPCNIIDNRPFCKCGSNDLSYIRDSKVVNIGGKLSLKVIKKCYSCNSDIFYYLDEVPLNGDNHRFIISESQEQEYINE